VKIYQLDRADNATYVVELFEVYPKTITAQDIGNATSDAYQTVTVELDFHHWKWVNDRTPAKRAFSDSIEEGMGMVRTYAHTIDKNQPKTGIQ